MTSLAKFLQSNKSFSLVVSEKKIFLNVYQQPLGMSVAAISGTISARNEIFCKKTLVHHYCAFVVTEEKISFKFLRIRNKNCLWQSCLLTNHHEMREFCIGPSIDNMCQVWSKWFQWRSGKCKKFMTDAK